MEGLFIYSLNAKIQEIKPGMLSMLKTIKVQSSGNLFGDLTLLKNYVLPKLNTLAAIEQQLSELTTNYKTLQTDKNKLDEELKNKIGEITGLTSKIAELNNDIEIIKENLKNKDLLLNELKDTLKSKEMEFKELELRFNELSKERRNLITSLTTLVKKYNPNTIINESTDFVALLEEIIKHLKNSESFEKEMIEFIRNIINTFNYLLPDLRFNKEIDSLNQANETLNELIKLLTDKIGNIEYLFTKYSDLFANNLLFESKLANLDSILEEHVLYKQFLIDIKTLISN